MKIFKNIKTTLLLVAFLMTSGAVHAATSNRASPSSASEYYLKALLYESQGNFISAQIEIQKALAIEPDSARLNKTAAELAFFLGQLQEARDAIEKANEADPDDTKAHILAGQIYWSLGDAKMAEKKLSRAVELSPDEAEPLVSLATALTSHDPKKAIQLYSNFLKRHPGAVEIHERLGQLYRSQGDLKSSKKSWKKALEWSPGSLRANLALAQIAEVNHDTKTAIVHYEAVLDRDPTNLPLLLRVGELQYRNNAMSEAYQAFSNAKKIAPESPSANFWMALLHEHRGEWEKAIKLLKNVSDRSPEPGVLLRLSYYYTQARKHKEAIAILEQLTAAEPENLDFLNYLAIAYEQDKQYAKATKTAARLVDVDDTNHEYRFYLATLLDKQKKFPKAEVELKKAIKLKPDYHIALNYLGYSYADRNENLKEAEKLMLRAIKLRPNKAAYLDSIGWVYYRLGRYQKAEDFLQRAARQADDPLIWEHLADVRVAKGEPDQAILAWDESLRLAPNQKKVMKDLNRTLKKLSQKEKVSLFVKRVSAGFTDMAAIEGLVNIRVCERAPCFESRGQVQYKRERETRIQVPGPLSGPILLIVKPYQKKGQYGALHPVFQTVEPFVVRAVKRLESVLSGDVFRNLNMVSVRNNVEKKGSRLKTQSGTTNLSFSNQHGFLDKVIWNEDGKEDELRFGDYDNSRWPWVPLLFEWKDKDTNFIIRLTLKDPVLTISPVSVNDRAKK